MKKSDKIRLRHLKIRSNEQEDLEGRIIPDNLRYVKLWKEKKR